MDISTSTFLEGCYYELGDCIADYEEQSVFEAKLNDMFTIDLSECATKEALQESFRDVVTKIKNAIKGLIEKFVAWIKRMKNKAMVGAIGALSVAGAKIADELKKNKKASSKSTVLDEPAIIAEWAYIGTYYVVKEDEENHESTFYGAEDPKNKLFNAIKNNTTEGVDSKQIKKLSNGEDILKAMTLYYKETPDITNGNNQSMMTAGEVSNKKLFGDAIRSAEDEVNKLKKLIREADNAGKNLDGLKKKLKVANTKYSLCLKYVSIILTSMKRLNKAGREILKKSKESASK